MEYEVADVLVSRSPMLNIEKYHLLYDLESGKKTIEEILEEESGFREAIAVSSPSLQKMIEQNHILSEQKKAIAKYIIRASMRPSPYGLFSGISNCKFGEKTNIIRFPSNSRQVRKDEKDYFTYGNFNMGFAHGVIGIYNILSKGEKHGFHSSEYDRAINIIKNLYIEKINIEIEGVVYWPGQIGTNDFLVLDTESCKFNTRQSWCYGSIGVSSSLLCISKWKEDKEIFQFSIENLKAIAEMDNKQYQIISPILCHGYAGNMTIFNLAYHSSEEKLFFKRCCTLCDRIIGMYEPRSKYGFYNARYNEKESFETIIQEDSFSFIEGTVGILLALVDLLVFDKLNIRKHLLLE